MAISKVPGKDLEHFSEGTGPNLEFFRKLAGLIQERHRQGRTEGDVYKKKYLK